MKKLNACLIALTSLTLVACSQSTTSARPELLMNKSWSVSQAGQSIPKEWWTLFDSAELNELIERALSNNHDLKAGLEQINQARASLKGSRSGLFPTVGVSAGAGLSKRESEETGDNWSAGLPVSYELDLFGSVRSGIDSAQARLAGSIYAYDALNLVTVGEVAGTYFSLLEAKELQGISLQNLDNARELLRIVQVRRDAGMESDLELAQQNSAYQQAVAENAAADANVKIYENALSILIGVPPQSSTFETGPLSGLRLINIDTGVPSDLLGRRPDILKAQADLYAADADIAAARAAFYPSVTLGLDWTLAASAFGDPATTAIALASRLTAPIFQGGRLEAGLEGATSRQKELAETFRQAVLQSFREVEDTLASLKAAAVRDRSLAEAQKSAQLAYDLAQVKYKAGSVDLQTVLQAQSALFQARRSQIQAQKQHAQLMVDLCKAVGGGLNQ